MYKTLMESYWNIQRNILPHPFSSSSGNQIGASLLTGALICPFLQNATTLVRATVILCSGGYAGLIFGFFGGIFYIYRGTVKIHSRGFPFSSQNIIKDTL